MGILQSISNVLECAVGELSTPEVTIQSTIPVWDVPRYWVHMLEAMGSEQPELSYKDYERVISLRVRSFDELFLRLWVVSKAVEQGTTAPEVNYDLPVNPAEEEINLVNLLGNGTVYNQDIRTMASHLSKHLANLMAMIDEMDKDVKDAIFPAIRIKYQHIVDDALTVAELLMERNGL